MKEFAWNLDQEYPGFQSEAYQGDLSTLEKSLTALEADPKMDPIKRYESLRETSKLWMTLRNYSSAMYSLNTQDPLARKYSDQLDRLSSRMQLQTLPFRQWLQEISNEAFMACFEKSQAFREDEFALEQIRALVKIKLSPAEEELLVQLRTSGMNEWSDLYEKISGGLKVEIKTSGSAGTETQIVSEAQAQSLLKSKDPEMRKQAYLGRRKAWGAHEETVASILNSLADFRLKEAARRSHTEKLDYLSEPLRRNRCSQKTLNAMMTALEQNKSEAQKLVKWVAKHFGSEKLQPWDHLAGYPGAIGKTQNSSAPKVTFSLDEGLQRIEDSFSQIDPEMGQFVRTMKERNLIEARVMPGKSGGGYCSHLEKIKMPIIFQTFMGTMGDLMTVAHELGHAFHYWVLRDSPQSHQSYPMTLAETASVFAEAVFVQSQLKSLTDPEQKEEIFWSEVERYLAFTLNIPVRFEFEKNFYEERKKGFVEVSRLKELYSEAWRKWYGDTLAELDDSYWASKGHFSMAYLGFYNFPYSFGYLFSLSVYARKDEWGSEFYSKYKAILKDTALMSCEDLVQKHFGESIETPDFWMKTLQKSAPRCAAPCAQVRRT